MIKCRIFEIFYTLTRVCCIPCLGRVFAFSSPIVCRCAVIFIMSSDSAGRGPSTQGQFGTQSSQLDSSSRYGFLDFSTQDTNAGYTSFTQVSFVVF